MNARQAGCKSFSAGRIWLGVGTVRLLKVFSLLIIETKISARSGLLSLTRHLGTEDITLIDSF
jgi:hypothetical protein